MEIKKKIITDDFFGDLFETGHIKLEKHLKNKEDIELIKGAMKVLSDFKEDLEKQNKIIYC